MLLDPWALPSYGGCRFEECSRCSRACGLAMRGVDLVVGVRGLAAELVAGAREAGVDAVLVETPAEAGDWLARTLQPGDAVLLKASRGVQLERALLALGLQ